MPPHCCLRLAACLRPLPDLPAPRPTRRSAAAQEEAREELLALEAIFGDDLSPAHDGRALGFALRVVPHPGEAAANYVSLTLVVRWVLEVAVAAHGCIMAAGRRVCLPAPPAARPPDDL